MPVFVALAHDGWCMRTAVKLLFELEFDQAALFLDHQDFVEPFSKLDCALRLQRPGHSHLVKTQAQFRSGLLRQVQLVERLQHIQIALAVRNDAQFRLRSVDDDAVDTIAACEGCHRAKFVAMQPRLLRMWRVGLANVHAVGRKVHALGQRNLHAVNVYVDRRGGFDRVLYALDANPTATEARHSPAKHTVIENLLNAGRAEHGDHHINHCEFALVAGS